MTVGTTLLATTVKVTLLTPIVTLIPSEMNATPTLLGINAPPTLSGINATPTLSRKSVATTYL